MTCQNGWQVHLNSRVKRLSTKYCRKCTIVWTPQDSLWSTRQEQKMHEHTLWAKLVEGPLVLYKVLTNPSCKPKLHHLCLWKAIPTAGNVLAPEVTRHLSLGQQVWPVGAAKKDPKAEPETYRSTSVQGHQNQLVVRHFGWTLSSFAWINGKKDILKIASTGVTREQEHHDPAGPVVRSLKTTMDGVWSLGGEHTPSRISPRSGPAPEGEASIVRRRFHDSWNMGWEQVDLRPRQKLLDHVVQGVFSQRRLLSMLRGRQRLEYERLW